MTEVKYGKSIKKLEEIIEKIESEEIDVDELSAKVKEAVALIKTCKNKIEKAELSKLLSQLKLQDEHEQIR